MEIDDKHLHRITSALRVLRDATNGYRAGVRLHRVTAHQLLDSGAEHSLAMAMANAGGALDLAEELGIPIDYEDVGGGDG